MKKLFQLYLNIFYEFAKKGNKWHINYIYFFKWFFSSKFTMTILIYNCYDSILGLARSFSRTGSLSLLPLLYIIVNCFKLYSINGKSCKFKWDKIPKTKGIWIIFGIHVCALTSCNALKDLRWLIDGQVKNVIPPQLVVLGININDFSVNNMILILTIFFQHKFLLWWLLRLWRKL